MTVFLAYTTWLIYALVAIGVARVLIVLLEMQSKDSTFEGLLESTFIMFFLIGIGALTFVAASIAEELFPDFDVFSLDRNGFLELGIVNLAMLGWTSLIVVEVVKHWKGSVNVPAEPAKPLHVSFNVVVGVLSAVASLLTIISVLVQKK